MFKRRNAPGSEAEASPESDSGSAPAPALESPTPPALARDNGLGVPPYRPAAAREVPAMARTPYTPPTVTTGPQPSGPTTGPQPGAGPRPGTSALARVPARETTERRTLVVGSGISLQGVVQDAERLVVEGTVEATMIHATELSISPGGVFKGEVEVEDAEVAGTIDGTLTARGSLVVRSSGKVLGAARCRRLQVEDGGQITGRVEMLTEPARPALADAS